MRFRYLSTAAVGALALGLLAAPAASAAGPLDVTTTKDTGQPGSLRAAIQAANAAGGGEIELRRGTYTLSLAGADDAAAVGDLDVTSPITIDGNGATVDARGIDRVFQVLAGAELVLDGVTVTGGVADDGDTVGNSGGGVSNSGTLVVDRSTITGNSAVRAGGGIEATAGSTTSVLRSALSRNTTGPTPGNGGGLHITASGTVTVDRSSVTGNVAAQEGGGLWNDAMSTMTVSRSVLSGNSANGAKADDGGGGLFNNGGMLSVDRSAVTGNTAGVGSGSGGGIFNLGGVLKVDSTVIDDNSAARAGGGIEANLGTTNLQRTVLSRNETGPMPGNGGGLHLTGAGTVTIDRGVVVRNAAANEGGGLWNPAGGTMTVTRTEIRDNTAPVGPNVFQLPPDGDFSIDGRQVPPGPNNL